MNKHQRFRAMLQGQPVDRVPAGFWHHFDAAYAGGRAMADRHLDYYRATGTDLLKVMNDTGYPPVGRLTVREPSDWKQLEPTPQDHPQFQSHIEGLRLIVQAIGGDVPIITTAFSPYRRAMSILRESQPTPHTMEQTWPILWQHMRDDPDMLHRAMEIITEDLAAYYEACITEGGIDGVYYSAKGGERSMCTDAEHAEFIRQYDLAILERLRGTADYIVGHFCGVGLNMERFRGYPIDLANWAQQSDNISLVQGRDLFGVSILGGLDERGPLVYGPREALRQEIDTSLGQMGSRGFMLGAGCTVPGDVDVDNLVYARQYVATQSAS